MMKVTAALIILCMPLVALARSKCGGTAEKFQDFGKKSQNPKVPCKYHAVLQTCGKYTVTITPGNIYLFPHYHLDTLWIAINETNGEGFWYGRTSNTKAVKYINGWKDDLVTRYNGNYETTQILTTEKADKEVYVETLDKAFRVTFKPWYPGDKKFPESQWEFECFENTNFVAADYPTQLCGNRVTKENRERKESFGFRDAYQLLYYDIFTNTKLAQTNPKCKEATHLMTTVCTESQQAEAMITCSDILYSNKHRTCVTKYSCDPMDVFVACVQYVCSDFEDKDACAEVAGGIDMCRNFKNGNLTGRVAASECYKEFFHIDADYDDKEEET